MLGEAWPDLEPEEHTRVSQMHQYGNAWVRDREPWLKSAGIAMTNVLSLRPPQNKLEYLCGAKKEVSTWAGSFPAVARGKYLREEYLGELDRLREELTAWQPNLVIALGNTATWALLNATNIGSIRGTISESAGIGTGELRLKVLPTYHPTGVLRQWAWRTIVIADLMKARREASYPDIRRPKRRVLVSPTQAEMLAWEQETYRHAPSGLSPDIETESGQITMIGFARNPSESMVIPFWDRGKPGYSYWSTAAEERVAFDCMERLLQYSCPKIGQNFIYDLQYLTKYGIRPAHCTEDTMLLHHSMFPEMQKGLGFLGSIYTSESSWKLLRKRKADTEKKDE